MLRVWRAWPISTEGSRRMLNTQGGLGHGPSSSGRDNVKPTMVSSSDAPRRIFADRSHLSNLPLAVTDGGLIMSKACCVSAEAWKTSGWRMSFNKCVQYVVARV